MGDDFKWLIFLKNVSKCARFQRYKIFRASILLLAPSLIKNHLKFSVNWTANEMAIKGIYVFGVLILLVIGAVITTVIVINAFNSNDETGGESE